MPINSPCLLSPQQTLRYFLTILDISNKETHTMCGLLWQVSFKVDSYNNLISPSG